MQKSKLTRGVSAVLATVVASTSMSLSAFAAIPRVNFTDNGNGTATVTGTDAERIAVAQYDEVGALKAFGISSLMGGKQTVNMSYDSKLDTYVYSFSDWSTLKSEYSGEKIGQRTVSVVDFDSKKQGSYVMYGLGVANIDDTYETTDKNGNSTKAMHIKRTTMSSQDYNAQFSGLATSTSDVVVYEYDFKPLDTNNDFYISLKTIVASSSSGPWQRIMTVSAKDSTSVNVVLGENGGIFQTTATTADWHKVAMVVDYKTMQCYYYYDGEYKGKQTFNTSYNSALHSPDIIIAKCDGNKNQDFLLDNIRVYEGTEPRETINAFDDYIDLAKNNIEPIDYSASKTALKGKYAVHLRSGATYDGNGNSGLLSNTPYVKSGEIYVPVAEICKAWGVAAPTSVTTEANGYGKLSDLAKALGLNVYTANSEINAGLAVVAKSFTAPTGDALQNMNDYVFYMRPTKEQIAKLYKDSPTNGDHPRIMATQSDFDRVYNLYNAKTPNKYIKAWGDQLIEYADEQINGYTDLKHEKYDGLRMDFQRTLQNLVSLWGMAYHITHDRKYVEYTYKALETVCNFPDWNPGHHLDTCEAMTAVSIGYDWLYNEFTPEQRKVIEEGMYKLGITQSYQAYLSTSTAMANAFTLDNNHGVIDNGAVIVSSLAFMDAYPKECSWMMSAALECIENSIYHWSTGMWYEGSTYWELTMMHTVKFISAMQTALGTDLGFTSLQGLDNSAKPEIASHGYMNIYNYGDATELRYMVPELIWLANEYKEPAIAEYVAEQSKDGFKIFPDREWWKNTVYKGEDTALALLWYDPAKQENADELKMDTVYYDEDLDILTVRNKWETDGQVFVGIKGRGGENGHSHLDSGSFIFESDGIRWVSDLGPGSYSESAGYFEWNSQSARGWKSFPKRAEAHSTVVVNPEADKADHIVPVNKSGVLDESLVSQLTYDKTTGIATVDMSKTLFDVTSATRKFKLVDNSQSLVIQDKITLDGTDNTLYWFLMTAEQRYTYESGSYKLLPCEIEEVENGFILTQTDENGTVHKARIDYVIESNGVLSTVPESGDYTKNVYSLFGDKALDMGTSGNPTKPDNREYQNKRLELKLTGVSGNVKITAKITPLTGVTGTMTSVSDYVNAF